MLSSGCAGTCPACLAFPRNRVGDPVLEEDVAAVDKGGFGVVRTCVEESIETSGLRDGGSMML